LVLATETRRHDTPGVSTISCVGATARSDSRASVTTDMEMDAVLFSRLKDDDAEARVPGPHRI
jgi:hypothetical protein